MLTMRNKTRFIAILAVIIIGVIGISAYLLQGTGRQQKELTPVSPTPASPQVPEIDTSDWKVYRNETFGFEVRYPSNWEVKEDYGKVSTFDFFGPRPDLPSDIEDHFTIQIAWAFEDGGKRASNLREWVRNLYPMKITIEDTTIDGYPAVIAHVPIGSEYTTPGSMIATLRNGYVFMFPILDEKDKVGYEIKKAIFSNFKFTK
jgi:hypothetical protein